MRKNDGVNALGLYFITIRHIREYLEVVERAENKSRHVGGPARPVFFWGALASEAACGFIGW